MYALLFTAHLIVYGVPTTQVSRAVFPTRIECMETAREHIRMLPLNETPEFKVSGYETSCIEVDR